MAQWFALYIKDPAQTYLIEPASYFMTRLSQILHGHGKSTETNSVVSSVSTFKTHEIDVENSDAEISTKNGPVISPSQDDIDGFAMQSNNGFRA